MLTKYRTSRLPLARPYEDLNRMFDRVFSAPLAFTEPETMSDWLPAIDVSETADEVIVKAEVPGVPLENIDIDLTDNVLTVKGRKEEVIDEKEEENFFHTERRFGAFQRSVRLPGGVKPEEIDARYGDGVLTIRIPKADHAKSKKIKIKTN